MYKTLIIIICIALFSCADNQNEGIQTKGPRYAYTGNRLDVSVIDIDSCEYVVAQTGFADGGLSIVHKNNCKYCKSR